MNFNRCILALNRAAGRELGADELQGMFERIQKTANDLKAGRLADAAGPQNLASPEGLIRRAAEIEAEAMVKEAERKAVNAVRDAKTAATRQAELAAMKGLGEVEAVKRLLVNGPDGKADQFSLESRVLGVSQLLKSKVQDTWLAMDRSFLEYLQRRDRMALLLREIKGEHTGDALARKGAEAWLKTAEESRLWFNEKGGKVGHLEDWGVPQHHSQEMVARAGKDAWMQFVLPRLQRERYTDLAGNPMNDAQVIKFLEGTWETIATNGATKIEPGQPKGSGARGNRHAEERQIHFKDADALIDYWGRFGERTFPDILMGHLETMAKDIAFVEHFGSNPDSMFRLLRDSAEKAAKTAAPTKVDKIDGQLARLDNLFDYASGKTKPVANQAVASGFEFVKNLNVAGKLGSAFWASLIGDKPMFEAMAHVNNLPAFQRWHNELRLLNPASRAERRQLRRQALMLDYMTQAMSRFGQELGQTSIASKLANGVMKVSGMAAVNEWRRGAWALTAMDTLGHMVRTKDFANVGKQDMRMLESYGITEHDWKVWKLAKLDDLGHGNDTALTPEAIGRIPDADLDKVIGARLQGIRDEAAAQIASLQARNTKEQGWIRGRIEKFDETRDAMNRWVKDRLSKRLADNEKAAGPMLERMAMLDAKRDAAKLQADMEADFVKYSTQDEIRSFLNAVEDGRSADLADVHEARPVVRQGLESAASVGRRYGVEKGRLEQRMREIEKRIARMDQEAGWAANKDAKGVERRAADMAADLQAFVDRSQERQRRRLAVADRLAREVEPDMAAARIDARRSAIVKLLGALTSESHLAVLEPGWDQRARMYGGLQRGNIRDELTRSFWQFKAFPIAQFETMWKVGLSRPTTGGKIGFMAMLPVMQTMAGMMMIQVQEMLAGRDPRPMGDWKFWLASFMKGGSLGLYGDFLFSQSGTTRYGTGPLEALAGPTIGAAADMVTFVAQAPGKINDGKDPQVAAKAVNIAKGFVPGQNLWYTKAATDHLIFQAAQEALNPGYLDSVRSRTEREFGNDWWWSPGPGLPERGPDIGAAFEAR